MIFIYSKFSPDVSYVQGMNEIIAPIYYCFSYDKLYEEENENDIEADTFWTFYLLMQKMKCVLSKTEKSINALEAGGGRKERELLILAVEYEWTSACSLF